ncbi:MAG: DNA-binding domain of REP protein [Cressdnaviricota sp.]|nr:MAG: DNA-binding domain of REP protein [Cressdnaviricota sp.]
MPVQHTEFFITVSQKDIGGTTAEQETQILEHYKSCFMVVLVREKHSSGEYHLHAYIKKTRDRVDNLKRKLYNLLYGDIDKSSILWKRRIVIKPVNDKYSTLTYMKKALDSSGEMIHCHGIDWKAINENLKEAATKWKMESSLTAAKTVSYTSVPALMNTFYRESMLSIDKTIDENPRVIFIQLMKAGQYLIFQHIPKLRGIIAQYRLLYMNDVEHMENYIEDCLNFN